MKTQLHALLQERLQFRLRLGSELAFGDFHFANRRGLSKRGAELHRCAEPGGDPGNECLPRACDVPVLAKSYLAAIDFVVFGHTQRFKSSAMVANCSRAASRSAVMSAAMTSGAGRFALSSSASSFNQKMSRFTLSRLTRSS